MPDVMAATWFTSRRVPLPLAAAATALDELVEHRRRDPTSGAVSLTDGLEVWPADARPHAARRGDARRLVARLRVSRLARPSRVELELGPWSRAESEVGIRPIRRPPRAERYWAAASDAVDALRSTLPAFAPAPMPALAGWRKASRAFAPEPGPAQRFAARSPSVSAAAASR